MNIILNIKGVVHFFTNRHICTLKAHAEIEETGVQLKQETYIQWSFCLLLGICPPVLPACQVMAHALMSQSDGESSSPSRLQAPAPGK